MAGFRRSPTGPRGANERWSSDQSLDRVRYSVYSQEQQAAFARVVTDEATFAWICDVFVDEPHRGRGLGTWLVESIVEDLEVLDVRRFLLATRDAHEVYRRCGFVAMEGTDRWMEIDRRPTRAAVLGLDHA